MEHDGQARHHCGGPHLTCREIEVLQLAARGLCSDEIACQLAISPRTVEDHLGEMRHPAEAANRCELVARCYAADILQGWPPRWSGRRCLRPQVDPSRSSPSAGGPAPWTECYSDGTFP